MAYTLAHDLDLADLGTQHLTQCDELLTPFAVLVVNLVLWR